MINFALHAVGSVLFAAVEAMPLVWVARLGRAGGWLAWMFDRRHRGIALANLSACFGGEKSAAELAVLCRENFLRIGEAFACGVKTCGMPAAKLETRVRFIGAGRLRELIRKSARGAVVAAVGHFGNFELYSRFGDALPGLRIATTYRGLDQPGLDRLLQRARRCSPDRLYFERRRESGALREALNRGNLSLGLLADQNAGDSGVVVPFFGRDCSTSAAPALFALRYEMPLVAAFCFRVALAQWEVVIGEEIPVRDSSGSPRSKEAIMSDVNRAFEEAVRRDPANWFWVHRRWKPGVGRRARMRAAATP